MCDNVTWDDIKNIIMSVFENKSNIEKGHQ